MARMPNGAVASMPENEATKNTIFFADLTMGAFRSYSLDEEPGLDGASSTEPGNLDSQSTNHALAVCLQIVKTLQNPTQHKLSYFEST